MRVVDESARLAGLWRVSVGLQDGAQAAGQSFSHQKRGSIQEKDGKGVEKIGFDLKIMGFKQ